MAAVVFAGCGGHARPAPALQRADAARLAALSDRLAVETGNGCAYARDARRLRAETTRLINAQRVPLPLSEPLSSAVNDLGARGPLCVPVATAPAPASSAPRSPGSGEKDRGARGHGKGHGKGHD